MHDTAFRIGTLAMNIYADLRSDAILEVGSQAVNGSLRDNALPSTRYVGVDIEEGDGVDLVAEPGKPLPVEDNSFDLVMASSVFEHDPAFWTTFLEMCRAAKDGGYIYINAPSNGTVHRYPQDNWRFYPDAGKALAQWAATQGCAVSLVESFIAKRDQVFWNDFVAVFRKGPIRKALPKVSIHEHVECTDVITWQSPEIINPSEQTEDMILLSQSAERVRHTEDELARTVGERDALGGQVSDLEVRLKAIELDHQQQSSEGEKLRCELNLRESELRQRQEEIEQTHGELAAARSLLASSADIHERRVLELGSELEQVRSRSRAAEESLESELEQIRSRCRAAEGKLDRLTSEKEKAESRLGEAHEEIAALTKILIQSERNELSARERSEWLRETGVVLANGSTTLKGRFLSLLPAVFLMRRQRRLLKRRGLFDGDAYLAAHDDIRADGSDPLRHYLLHGLSEDRARG